MGDANQFMTAIDRVSGRPYGIRPRTAHIPQMLPNLGSTRAELHTYSSSTTPAFDAGARAAGAISMPGGTPRKYGKYFGIKPPGSFI